MAASTAAGNGYDMGRDSAADVAAEDAADEVLAPEHSIVASGGDEVPVRIEFTRGPGLQQVALTPSDLAQRSGEALAEATGMIMTVARKLHGATRRLAHAPKTVEVSFGVKFDAAAGALIAKAGAEAALTIRLVWERETDPGPVGASADATAVDSPLSESGPSDPQPSEAGG